MSANRTQAIVLRRTNYGEADRILQLLTPEGRRSVIAKGARKEKSRLAGGIELFAVCDIVITQGRGELGLLTSARLVQFYRHIMEDYDTMQFAYEAVKHITRASEMVDEPDWFDVLREVLMGLDVLTIPRQLVQTWFYVRYAQLLGDELNLRSDINGQALEADKKYTYDVAEKGLRLNVTGDITSDHIKFLRLLGVKSIQTLAQVGGLEPILGECWMVTRQHATL
jgi:DNA repair protein RecO